MLFQIGIGIAIAISISDEDRDRIRDLNFGDRGHALLTIESFERHKLTVYSELRDVFSIFFGNGSFEK